MWKGVAVKVTQTDEELRVGYNAGVGMVPQLGMVLDWLG